LLSDGVLLISSQRLLHRRIQPGVEALVASKLLRGTRRRCHGLDLLLKALLLLIALLLPKLLLSVVLLCRLLWSPLLRLLGQWLCCWFPAHSLERVVSVHHLQTVRDSAMSLPD
jgi:hypothetical protein